MQLRVIDQAGVQPQTRALLSTKQAARYLGLAVSTLNKWRCYGEGPKFLKLGRAVRYMESDLQAFVKGRRLGSTAEIGA